jgi:hypothetical protein
MVACAVVLAFVLIHYRRRLVRLVQPFFCQHMNPSLSIVGAALISANREVEMMVEISCECGYINHRSVDATNALRDALGVKR